MAQTNKPSDIDGIMAPHMEGWVKIRHDLHAHPELKFEENRTADVVARELAAYGYEPQRGLIGTDIVATLPGKDPSRGIILRADMDALAVHENTGLAYASREPGKMHACGHDGHTVMLLAAAKVLREMPQLPGNVHFVFQPGEEGGAGAQKMIDAGLFEKHPAEAVFGLHNWPTLPQGEFGVRPGPIMGAGVRVGITVRGKGTHAAQPHRGIDPLPIACSIVLQCQVLMARYKNALDPAVMSICTMTAGDAENVIPDEVEMRGTIRTLSSKLLETLQGQVREIATGLAAIHGAQAEVVFRQVYPVTMNSVAETKFCEDVIRSAFPGRTLHDGIDPNLTSEDFGFMLEKRPGAYVLLGAAQTGKTNAPLHNPAFDFNDNLIGVGAKYWAQLATDYFAQ